jgi:hypothetical protein
MHVHVGALSTAITFAEVVIVLFLLRMIAARWPDSPVGKASAALN